MIMATTKLSNTAECGLVVKMGFYYSISVVPVAQTNGTLLRWWQYFLYCNIIGNYEITFIIRICYSKLIQQEVNINSHCILPICYSMNNTTMETL